LLDGELARGQFGHPDSDVAIRSRLRAGRHRNPAPTARLALAPKLLACCCYRGSLAAGIPPMTKTWSRLTWLLIALGCTSTPLGPSPDGSAGSGGGSAGGGGGSAGSGGGSAGSGGGAAPAACDSCVVIDHTAMMSWECYCWFYPATCGHTLPACTMDHTRTVHPGCGLTVEVIESFPGPMTYVYDSSGARVGASLSNDTFSYGCPNSAPGSAFRIQAGRFPDSSCPGQPCTCGDAGATCGGN
jgi:hypothetical protein